MMMKVMRKFLGALLRPVRHFLSYLLSPKKQAYSISMDNIIHEKHTRLGGAGGVANERPPLLPLVDYPALTSRFFTVFYIWFPFAFSLTSPLIKNK